jgi:hypothetical protein
MLTVERIREIRRAVRRGEPEGELKERLREEGYSDEEIAVAFAPHKYDMRSWYLIFGIITSLAGLIVLKNTGGLLILILGALLFAAYYGEIERLKKEH